MNIGDKITIPKNDETISNNLLKNEKNGFDLYIDTLYSNVNAS